MAISAYISDDKTRPVRADETTRALETIDYEHHEIHDGNAFVVSKSFTHGAGASPNVLIVTPNTTKWAHFIFQVISDDVVTVTLYETSDYTGGNALTEVNRNRNSSTTATVITTDTATDGGSGKGTAIWTFKAGANKTVTNAASDRFEFILKQNENYLIEAVGANGDLITVLLDWYEHTNKL